MTIMINKETILTYWLFCLFTCYYLLNPLTPTVAIWIQL